ncbi:MAG: ATP synthase F1 subunit gamma [Armatimonadetes bacterium]|nr:ATP synthase F1 subunit gamma [Armatimonadota bacterium]
MPEDLRTIRRKLRTVNNIWQLTRAMKMVAAARLRRFQQALAAGHAYWDNLLELTQRLVQALPEVDHPYLSQAPPQRPALVVVAGDKGLCGSYNSLVFRRAEAALEEIKAGVVIAVGERARRWAQRRQVGLAGALPALGGRQASQVPTALAGAILAGFDRGDFDGVYVVYTPFRSMLYNIPKLVQVLPIGRPPGLPPPGQPIFEPDPKRLVSLALPMAVRARLAAIVVEAAAAEQAARMTAMGAAADNAEELAEYLTRLRNRLRQQEITTEILEVVAGAESLRQGGPGAAE